MVLNHLRERVFDALIELHAGRAQIGGPGAEGLRDNPVVVALYDAGMVDAVGGVWGLTRDGAQAAAFLSALAQHVFGRAEQ